MKTILNSGFIFILFSSIAVGQEPNNPLKDTPLKISKWKNELGSTLEITEFDPKSGAIKGNYISPEGTGGKSYPLVGWINTSQQTDKDMKKVEVVIISFTVNWKEIGSITSWTGSLENKNGKPRLVMEWHLGRPKTGYTWERVLTGEDRFSPEK